MLEKTSRFLGDKYYKTYLTLHYHIIFLYFQEVMFILFGFSSLKCVKAQNVTFFLQLSFSNWLFQMNVLTLSFISKVKCSLCNNRHLIMTFKNLCRLCFRFFRYLFLATRKLLLEAFLKIKRNKIKSVI